MKSIRLLAVGLAAATLLGVTSPAAADDLARGRQLFSLCSQCHGDAGQGNQAIGAPAIAGLPVWYVKGQLEKFSRGIRGKHFDDLEGMRMRPMSLWLVAHKDDPALGEANIANVATYVASLAPAKPAPTLAGGDAARGAESYMVCGTCHGQNGEGSEPVSAPPLVGQSDWYLFASLQKYKAGVRGYDPANDGLGAAMAGMASILADEQAMRDVVAHIMTLE